MAESNEKEYVQFAKLVDIITSEKSEKLVDIINMMSKNKITVTPDCKHYRLLVDYKAYQIIAIWNVSGNSADLSAIHVKTDEYELFGSPGTSCYGRHPGSQLWTSYDVDESITGTCRLPDALSVLYAVKNTCAQFEYDFAGKQIVPGKK